jgi:hypothetical protein
VARPIDATITDAERVARRTRVAAPDVKRSIEMAARAGYLVKGVIYAIIGALAVMTALGFSGGRIVGTESAIQTLRTQPFGQFLLWAVALGLIGYVVWRIVEAVGDPERRGNDFKGLAQRIGLGVSGLTHATLAVFTVRLALGRGDQASDDGNEASTAMLMQHSWGIWIVLAIGLVLIGIAGYQAYRAYAIKFERDWHVAEMSAQTRRYSVALSRFGIAARAVAFGLIGWFFVQAAIEADPSEAKGLTGALRSFYEEPYGEVWLTLIGLGFVCYGIYCAINARFKRIRP